MRDVPASLSHNGASSEQRLFPIVGDDGSLAGVITRSELLAVREDGAAGRKLGDVANMNAIVAAPDEPLRVVAQRMARSGYTRLPVIERGQLTGIVSLADLLQARLSNLDAEQRRERVLVFPRLLPWIAVADDVARDE